MKKNDSDNPMDKLHCQYFFLSYSHFIFNMLSSSIEFIPKKKLIEE